MPKRSQQLEDIEDRIAIEPFNAELHQSLGKALRAAGDRDAARNAFEQATVLDPSDPWSHLYLGNLSYEEEDYSEALEIFTHAHELAPDLAMSLICMADACHSLGKLDLADQYYHRAVQVDPLDDIATQNLERWLSIKEDL